MKGFLGLVVGIGLGFAVAHRVNQTPGGKNFFTSLDTKARAFGQAIADGYHERDSELRQSESLHADR